MKYIPKEARPFLYCMAIVLALQIVLEYVVFPVDLLVAIRNREQGPLAAVTLLVVTRGFLYFVAPGWTLYWIVRAILERRAMVQSA